MTLFKYKAKQVDGTLIDGTMEAPDKYALARDLKAAGSVVLHTEEIGEKEAPGSKKMLGVQLSFGSGVSLREKIVFIRNLAAMIEAGLALTRAIGVLERQTRNKRFQQILHALFEDVSSGSPLSEAMKKHPKIFTTLFVAMVKAGEESGKMPESLRIIGEHLEKSYALRKKIRGAMMYPAVVVFAMLLIGVLMLIYVVPTLTSAFIDLKVELPASTKLIIFLSNALIHNYILFFAGAATLIFGLVSVMRTERGQEIFGKIILYVPLIGGLVREVNAARTTRTLSALLSSGVDMVDALAITEDVVQHRAYKAVLKIAGEDVQKGVTLSTIFSQHEKLYPILVTEMMAVGEETGQLSAMLMRVASFYEDEVDEATKDMSTIIEPFLMIFIGGAVGFFAIAMMSPMYSLAGSIN